MSTVHIGCGAGFAGDRFDAAGPVLAELARREGPKFLMFECLAERTLALAQEERRRLPERGWSPFLDRYLAPHLGAALAGGVRIVTNLGAANPLGAARRVQALAAELGLPVPRVAALTGDDLRETMEDAAIRALPLLDGADVIGKPLLSANVYLGAQPVAAALATGADVVLVGRTTDSALALGPLIHALGWDPADLDLMAAGTIAGHLLECGAQATGAYFADPGLKDVPDLAHVGFPVARIDADGTLEIGKPEGTGGRVDRATITEQLLYEMHDPSAYLVPDCTADITAATLTRTAPDRITLRGIRGHPPPERLKATVCVEDGWMGEAEISYAGPNALARTSLAAEVVRARLAAHNLLPALDIIGAGAALDRGDLGRSLGRGLPGDGDYRLRAALRAEDRDVAARVCEEVTALYCSGPAGGGGVRTHLAPQVATASVLVPRAAVRPRVTLLAPDGTAEERPA